MRRKRKPIERDELMARTRAVGYSNAVRDEDTAMAGFLAIFHPELSEQQRRNIVRDRKRP